MTEDFLRSNNILEVERLKKYFPVEKGPFSQTHDFIHAVDDVSFKVKRGETFGIVGESASGKTTIAKIILGLIPPTEGNVFFMGKNIINLEKKEMKKIRKNMGIIFQDPFASLNPRKKIGDILNSPLKTNTDYSKKERKEMIIKVLESVELRPASHIINLYPQEFSGGQRQRIAIARSIIVKPTLIVADEPVTALDVSIQSQILNLLLDLKKNLNLTYIFIAHDLVIIKYLCDNILVMYSGKPMELSTNEKLFRDPSHPYTRALMSAIPKIGKYQTLFSKIKLIGDMPSQINPPPGCRFHTRCPYTKTICQKEEPEWKEIGEQHFIACHLHPIRAARAGRVSSGMGRA